MHQVLIITVVIVVVTVFIASHVPGCVLRSIHLAPSCFSSEQGEASARFYTTDYQDLIQYKLEDYLGYFQER